jgi:hypothetical protein
MLQNALLPPPLLLPEARNITYMTIWFARSRTLASSGHSTLSRAPCCRFRESLLVRVDSRVPVSVLIIGVKLLHNGEDGASLIMENSLSIRWWGLDVLVLRNCGHDNRLWLLPGLVCNPTWDSLLFMLRCFWQPHDNWDEPLTMPICFGEKLQNGVLFDAGMKYVTYFQLI